MAGSSAANCAQFWLHWCLSRPAAGDDLGHDGDGDLVQAALAGSGGDPAGIREGRVITF